MFRNHIYHSNPFLHYVAWSFDTSSTLKRILRATDPRIAVSLPTSICTSKYESNIVYPEEGLKNVGQRIETYVVHGPTWRSLQGGIFSSVKFRLSHLISRPFISRVVNSLAITVKRCHPEKIAHLPVPQPGGEHTIMSAPSRSFNRALPNIMIV